MYSVYTLETDSFRLGEDTSLIAYRITTEAFTNLNVGYASTLAVMLFIVMAVFSFINIKFMNKLAD